jgi:hypothetical protein
LANRQAAHNNNNSLISRLTLSASYCLQRLE